MNFKLAFGKGVQTLNIPDGYQVKTLLPNEVEVDLTNGEEVIRALENPIGSGRLRDIVSAGETVVIITSDITRPVPSKYIVPHIIDELLAGGVKAPDITVVFALGSHRTHTEQEMRYLVGDAVFEQIRCVDSDPDDCVHLGTTKAGTPVDVFSTVVNADRRICVGNVEYHYFAGYSGGAKAIMPGVSTRSAIQANHSMMVRPEACAGVIDGNPVREDIEDVVRFIPIDFIVNVVLDERKQIVHAAAGHHVDAHREACTFLDRMYKAHIIKRADVVIVSPGGYPKDINLYQAQKALDNAKHAVKDGGTIILVASCKEGLGEHAFERWMTQSESPQFMVEEIARNFELGGHKAAAIALVLQQSRIILVSDLFDAFVKSIFLEPQKDVQSALDAVLKDGDSIIVMPFGGATLPKLF
jgi:nickel-dependent lactate racemase